MIPRRTANENGGPVDAPLDEPVHVALLEEVGGRRHREGERGHRQEQAADAQRREAEHERHPGGHDRAAEHGQQDLHVVAPVEEGGGGAAEARQRPLPEGDVPRQPREDVEGDGDHGVDEHQ
jgi:hypothetical protein